MTYGFGGPPPGDPPPDPDPEEPAQSVSSALLSADMKIHVWRAGELEKMGFHPDYADLMAGDRTIDLHNVQQMLRDGCNHDTAVDLLL